MRRASVARRTSAGLGSPASFRSRSQERVLEMGGDRSLDHAKVVPPKVQNRETKDDNADQAASNGEIRRYKNDASKKGHRRAMSDPFDTPELGGVTDGDLKNSGHHSTGDKPPASSDTEDELYDDDCLGSDTFVGLPTLPRYPVAQTQDKNCWSEPPIDIFRVRGKNYLSNKKKIASNPFLIKTHNCDLFLSKNPNQYKIKK